MRFNLAAPGEAKLAANYFKQLTDKKILVELKKVSPKRTLSQNSYLHMLIGAFGSHFGYTLEEAKQIYKEINADIFKYEKKGRTFWRSSAEVSKEEMAKSIDRLMEKSADAGYPLPLATNQDWIRQIENEMERSRYL